LIHEVTPSTFSFRKILNVLNLCLEIGVGRSLPRASFFDDNLGRTVWESSTGAGFGLNNQLRVLNTTDDGLARTWARSQVIGELAKGQEEILKHINTANTAQDMLTITEAHGKQKLQYWGFS
jgi:hypothetical protein